MSSTKPFTTKNNVIKLKFCTYVFVLITWGRCFREVHVVGIMKTLSIKYQVNINQLLVITKKINQADLCLDFELKGTV